MGWERIRKAHARAVATSAPAQRRSSSTGGLNNQDAQRQARQGGGRALDAATRAHYEPRMGVKLDAVRVHDDAGAAEQAAAVGARAFTRGNDIFLGSGAGDETLAHELVHTAQPHRPGGGAVSSAGDASEREADTLAPRLAAGEPVRPRAVRGAAIQRESLKVPGYYVSTYEMTPVELALHRGCITTRKRVQLFNDRAYGPDPRLYFTLNEAMELGMPLSVYQLNIDPQLAWRERNNLIPDNQSAYKSPSEFPNAGPRPDVEADLGAMEGPIVFGLAAEAGRLAGGGGGESFAPAVRSVQAEDQLAMAVGGMTTPAAPANESVPEATPIYGEAPAREPMPTPDPVPASEPLPTSEPFSAPPPGAERMATDVELDALAGDARTTLFGTRSDVVEREYNDDKIAMGLRMWYDRNTKLLRAAEFNLEPPQGKLPARSFRIDKSVDRDLQLGYGDYTNQPYERFHVVPREAATNYPEALKLIDTMTNIVPGSGRGASGVNQGEWRMMERIAMIHADLYGNVRVRIEVILPTTVTAGQLPVPAGFIVRHFVGGQQIFIGLVANTSK